MKFDIKHRITGDVIFTAEIDCVADLRCANLRHANLRCANLRHANLRHANLRHANLRHADLSYANLTGADLSYADLRDADLSYADLSYADLRDANLSGANLRCADLSHADLWGTIGNMKEVKSMQLDTYSIIFTCGIMQIGCKRYNIEEWKEFSDEQINQMDTGALDWWKKWKEIVFMAIEKSSV